MKVTFWSSEISALFLYFFFLVHNFTRFYVKFVNLALKNSSILCTEIFYCWLVPPGRFSLLSFLFSLVPGRFGLSRPVPNAAPHPSQAISVAVLAIRAGSGWGDHWRQPLAAWKNTPHCWACSIYSL